LGGFYPDAKEEIPANVPPSKGTLCKLMLLWMQAMPATK
jgi:hypothetical protein